MYSKYFSRATRYICVAGIHYCVEAKVLKEGDVKQRNKGFNFFIKEIKKGTEIEKAKKRAWNSYRVKISYELKKYNPKCEKLIVTVE